MWPDDCVPSVPTLVVVGTSDSIVPSSSVRQSFGSWQARLRGVKVLTLEGSGHGEWLFSAEHGSRLSEAVRALRQEAARFGTASAAASGAASAVSAAAASAAASLPGVATAAAAVTSQAQQQAQLQAQQQTQQSSSPLHSEALAAEALAQPTAARDATTTEPDHVGSEGEVED